MLKNSNILSLLVIILIFSGLIQANDRFISLFENQKFRVTLAPTPSDTVGSILEYKLKAEMTKMDDVIVVSSDESSQYIVGFIVLEAEQIQRYIVSICVYENISFGLFPAFYETLLSRFPDQERLEMKATYDGIYNMMIEKMEKSVDLKYHSLLVNIDLDSIANSIAADLDKKIFEPTRTENRKLLEEINKK